MTDAASETDQLAPERVLHRFILAMMMKDQAELELTMLPHDESDVFLQGDAPPAAAIEQFRSLSDNLPQAFSRLEVGDSVKLPGGTQRRVNSEMANDSRVMVRMQGSPIPFIIVQQNGRWQVDATPVIAGRKAAAASR